jgi:hypothetical protein
MDQKHEEMLEDSPASKLSKLADDINAAYDRWGSKANSALSQYRLLVNKIRVSYIGESFYAEGRRGSESQYHLAVERVVAGKGFDICVKELNAEYEFGGTTISIEEMPINVSVMLLIVDPVTKDTPIDRFINDYVMHVRKARKNLLTLMP